VTFARAGAVFLGERGPLGAQRAEHDADLHAQAPGWDLEFA
jgi:hypothetical protein